VFGSGRLPKQHHVAVAGCAPESGTAASVDGTERRQAVRAAETRLLYENGTTGAVASFMIASLLAYAQWGVISPKVISVWWLFMLAVSVARFLLVRRYWRASPIDADHGRWNLAFVIGAAAAAVGWSVAAIALYPPGRAMNETFLIFVIGGVMLGGASLLAARPEAFLTFLIPPGILSGIRLASVGDEAHLMMGFLTTLFTVSTLATTWRFHLMIDSSFRLRFDNHELIKSLQRAKNDADALNRDLELRVGERTAKLVEADQRKNEFLATLAHELRNPLAPIRFALESLKEGTAPAGAARAREVMDRQVRQLVRLVDDLMDVSRITANKIHLRREAHDLARLMATAVESIMPLATASDLQLHVRLPVTPMRVDGDGTRLVQIFANVLNNAVKFTPPGGQVWFTAEEQSNEAVVRIRDTGIGIAPEVLPRVFEMFEQGEPILERSFGGLGIGLTLARRLVEMHEGRIEVTSPGTGQGTEVEIRLPITPVEAAGANDADASIAAASRTLRVLIVEDNLDAAEMLQVAVAQLGHDTKVAYDGGSAVTLATEFAPDVVLLDIGLPIMNGYAVARILRQLPEFTSVHIAAVTGWGQDEDRRKAREAGFDSHFTKPLSPVALQNLLATIAHGTRSRAVTGSPRTRLMDSGSAF
jgi:signal transduction histidine kinase/ActR/RegA family two-component response regulator